MMKHSLLLLCLLVIALPARAAGDYSIAAVVNEDAISMRDVTDRMRLIIVSSGLPNTEETRNRVRPQVLNSLIEEQIKLQAAQRNEIEVSPEEVAGGFQTLADQNNLEPEQFAQIMQQQGIPKNTLNRQIRAQIAWSKVVQAVLRPRIDVTETDVSDRLSRMRSQLGQTEYLVSQIFLPVGDAGRESEVRGLAEKLRSELQRGAPFQAVAAQFSKAPGASNGGRLGWIRPGQLEPALDQTIQTMQPQSLSEPVKALEGYHILWLQQKRDLSEESIPPREEIVNMVGMERLDREQQRYLADLKAAAFIDRRV